MADMMTFPETWEEFEKSYGFVDDEEVYTNGSRLIPSFRVKQWLDHIAQPNLQPTCNQLATDTISRQGAKDVVDMELDAIDHVPEWVYDRLLTALDKVPSAQPDIIRCKDCKYRQTDDCPIYYEEWIEIDEGGGYFDSDNIIHDWTTDEGFCHCAELRGKEE